MEGETAADHDFQSDEAAARYHLSLILADDDRPAVRGVTAPESPARVPGLRLAATQDVPQTNTRVVRFEQTKDGIPIFGSKAVCELDERRELVSASGAVGHVEGVSSRSTLSAEQALARIAEFTGSAPAALSDVPAPQPQFYLDGEKVWHLVYLFKHVPVAPPGLLEESEGHGLDASPRERTPSVTYLVDAHDGSIVLYFSDVPLATSTPLPVPVLCKGISEDGISEEFWGLAADAAFELHDPSRRIVTYDFELGDIESPAPDTPFRSDTADFGDAHKALVSAHANATRVDKFVRNILIRNGIDGNGMDLVNVVNCTYSQHGPGPEWRNAVWYENRMWYGQQRDADGTLVSFARFLDVIAHEMMHGVTKATADLVYRAQPGALNESFSDIFGVIVNNWQDPDGGDVDTWDWEIGSGLGANGLPLRDFHDPTRTGDPDHISKYDTSPRDSYGVHTNSNIHNKAAYNVLTARDADGARAFAPREVAYFYYLALTRLGRTDEFEDVLEAVTDVIRSYHLGDLTKGAARIALVRDAYRAVGIE
ncbi:MAG TPA: M4 family metallopeptidase [Solirubrobacteraceae bacterium]